jgi:hypothetical protein
MDKYDPTGSSSPSKANTTIAKLDSSEEEEILTNECKK